jgi:hypothetical protein
MVRNIVRLLKDDVANFYFWNSRNSNNAGRGSTRRDMDDKLQQEEGSMTLKNSNGKLGWIIGGLSLVGMLITIILFTSTFQSRIAKVDELNVALMESKVDRGSMHVDIATLKECARNTEAKLSAIDQKIDRILERNSRVDYKGMGK